MPRPCIGPGLLLAVAALLAGCATHAERVSSFRQEWHAGDFAAAEGEIDALLAAECGARSPDEVDPARGSGAVLLLDKGMARLASGDPAGCVRALRMARDGLDANAPVNLSDWFGTALLDDEARSFAGADYEVVLVRAVLALSDLLCAGGDAYAYALQVGEKQEEILGSDFGDPQSGYFPRRQYERLAVGAYLQGILREEDLAPSDAALAFERGLRWAEGRNAALASSVERARKGRYAPEGCGVLHVFYLGGSGPHLVPGRGDPSDAAIAVAAVGLAVAGKGIANLGQAPVPVPRVAPGDFDVPPLAIRVDGGGESVGTVSLLEVNRVAVQQLEANMPGIVARALVRRAVKGAVGSAIEGKGDDGRSLLGLVFTAVSTGLERAETRCWTSLPAEFQVARIALPEGDHVIDLGPGMEAPVRIARGRGSYVVVVRPNLGAPGAVLVDARSRVEPRAATDGSLPPIPVPPR